MLTFYFDLWDGKRVDLDEIGLELEGSEAAFEEAVKGARDMLRDAAIKRQNASKWAYQVRDEAGQPLFTVPFSMAGSDRH